MSTAAIPLITAKLFKVEVCGSIRVSGFITVEADSEMEALDIARTIDLEKFDWQTKRSIPENFYLSIATEEKRNV